MKKSNENEKDQEFNLILMCFYIHAFPPMIKYYIDNIIINLRAFFPI